MIQRGIPDLNPVCAVCIHGLEGTCDGAERPEDLFSWHKPNRPDCTNPARQVEFSVNLARYRPEPVLNLPVVPPLPPFVPVLEAGLPKGLVLPGGQLYGVGLRTIVSKHGRLKTESAEALRRSLRLPADARLCLSCSCDDARIEKLWERCLELDTWRGIARLGFQFASGMTFSVWAENPRFTQRYNIERNLASVDFFAEKGVPVVPILFCPRESDVRQAVRWLDDRPSVRTIGGLAQFHKSPEEFRIFLEGFLRVREALGRDFDLLVIGCATGEKIAEVFHHFPCATIMTNKPIRKGTSGHGFSGDLNSAGQPERPREGLITENIALFTRICAGFREGKDLLDSSIVEEHAVIRDQRQLELPGFATPGRDIGRLAMGAPRSLVVAGERV